DIYVLDHGGNLIDASAIATLAALLTTKVPRYTVTENELIQVDKSSYAGLLPVIKKALTVTVGKLGDSLIVDPTIEEEKVVTAKLVVGVGEDGSIAGLQKSGDGYLTLQEVEKAIELALRKGNELMTKVAESLKVLEVASSSPAEEEKRESPENKSNA
ncbi:MAG: exosome complex component Rrp42, partial [Zestosphaera sp.]